MIQPIENVWQQFHLKLKSFINSKVHDNSIADDMLQEVFIRIHTNIHTLKDETRLQSWIYQITRNVITDYYRKAAQQRIVPFSGNTSSGEQEYAQPERSEPGYGITLQTHLPGSFVFPEAGSDDTMAEAVEDMIKMMKALPPEYCEALCLTELEGLSQKEYAERAGLSWSGAKSRVQRARKILRDMLMRCCHYQFDRYGTVIGIYPAHCCCCQHPQS